MTLTNGEIIKFEADNAPNDDPGTSYAVDEAGVLTIESREQRSTGELVIRRLRFSPSSWLRIEDDTVVRCSAPPWAPGVIGTAAVGTTAF